MFVVQDRRDLADVELKDAKAAAVTLVEATRTAAQQKDSEARQAETEWKQAEEDLRKSSVVPPIAGRIDRRLVSNGMQVLAGTPLASLVGEGLKLRFTLPEQEATRVGEKTPVTFKVLAYPDREFRATIYYVSDLADAKTRAVTCWAKVEAADAVLKGNFFATVRIVTEERPKAVVIPITAALPTEYGFVVYVVEDGRASRRRVTLGLQLADQAVEVLSGLSGGETVVVEGANALQNGVPVREASEGGQEKAVSQGEGQSPAPESRVDPPAKAGTAAKN
jgi:RND family efflux transporter MFP subunit